MAAKAVNWERDLAKGFMLSVPERQRDALARAYRALPSVADDLRRYAERVMGVRGGAQIVGVRIEERRTLGLITKADVERIAALDRELRVEGFDYVVDRSAVRHVMKEHGVEAVERARGQRAVMAADFARLPEILNNPDSVEDAGLSDIGRRSVRLVKTTGDERFTAIFEVRPSRRSLALLTMFVGPAR